MNGNKLWAFSFQKKITVDLSIDSILSYVTNVSKCLLQFIVNLTGLIFAVKSAVFFI